MVRLICGNCGKVEKFDSYHEAYMDSWDTPDRFVYTACNQCPGVSVLFPMLALQDATALEHAGKHDEAEAKRKEAAAHTLTFEPKGS